MTAEQIVTGLRGLGIWARAHPDGRIALRCWGVDRHAEDLVYDTQEHNELKDVQLVISAEAAQTLLDAARHCLG